MRKRKPQGIVIYDGPSLINGDDIIAIVTGFRGSDNPKTGNMLQTWILPKNTVPLTAFFNGNDESVCGTCKHRFWGTCYVNICHGPQQIWKAYKRGKYDKLTRDNTPCFKGKKTRIGAYGDPAAIPYEIWKIILKQTSGYTGYTHQWKTCDPRISKICMASVDTAEEALKAKLMGWRWFRDILPDDELLEDEYRCPASAESGHKTTCMKCGACSGQSSKSRKNPVIIIHGQDYKIKRFTKIMKARRNKKKYTHLIPENLRNKETV